MAGKTASCRSASTDSECSVRSEASSAVESQQLPRREACLGELPMPTSLLVRGLASKWTQEALFGALEDIVGTTMDFFCLFEDAAWINCINGAGAQALAQLLPRVLPQQLSISWIGCQGLSESVRLFVGSGLLQQASALPILKLLGQRVRFDTWLAAALPCEPQSTTTVMLRGIPRRSTQQTVVAKLEEALGKGSFDFFYLPCDAARRVNVGFAFINFTSPVLAAEVLQAGVLRNVRLGDVPRELRATKSQTQGLAKNLEHYLGSPVVEDGRAPVVYHRGQRISFRDAAQLHLGAKTSSAPPPGLAAGALDRPGGFEL